MLCLPIALETDKWPSTLQDDPTHITQPPRFSIRCCSVCKMSKPSKNILMEKAIDFKHKPCYLAYEVLTQMQEHLFWWESPESLLSNPYRVAIPSLWQLKLLYHCGIATTNKHNTVVYIGDSRKNYFSYILFSVNTKVLISCYDCICDRLAKISRKQWMVNYVAEKVTLCIDGGFHSSMPIKHCKIRTLWKILHVEYQGVPLKTKQTKINR